MRVRIIGFLAPAALAWADTTNVHRTCTRATGVYALVCRLVPCRFSSNLSPILRRTEPLFRSPPGRAGEHLVAGACGKGRVCQRDSTPSRFLSRLDRSFASCPRSCACLSLRVPLIAIHTALLRVVDVVLPPKRRACSIKLPLPHATSFVL